MTPPHSYILFGLTVHSMIALPELVPVAPVNQPDVTIELGAVVMPNSIDQTPQPIAGGSAIAIVGVARYAIRSGAQIIVEPEADAPTANVRLYLLGSAMGMLLHQRGLLPLHANAIEVDGCALAFMGSSGSGKSTLAAWFHDRGFAVISDDVCAVRFDSAGRAVTSPGLPRLRLWRDAVERSGRDPKRFPRSYAGDETYDKFDVGLGQSAATSRDIVLGAIYLLRESDRSGITPLTGAAGLEALFANTYRGAYVADSDQQRGHWRMCVDLAAALPVFALDRVPGLERLPAEIDAILAHARTVALAVRAA